MKRLILVLPCAFRVLACQEAPGERVLARDLAPAIPGFESVPPETDLGAAPAVGSRRVFEAAELARLGQKLGVRILPDPVCVQRASQSLTAERLLPLLRALNGAVTEVVDYTRAPLPLGEIEFRPPGPGPSGIWRGSVRYGNAHSVPIWVKVRMTDSVAPTQVNPRNGVRKEVEPGDSVHVEVVSALVRLAFDAQAQSGGRSGELVLIRNPVNGARFQGRVDAAGKVVIQK